MTTAWEIEPTGSSGRGRYALELGRLRVPAVALLGGTVVLAHLPNSVGLPCPLRTLTGVPCPFCGTTTALRQLGAGHLRASLSAAPLGIALVLVALVVTVLGMARRLPSQVRVHLWMLAPLLAAEWLFELHRFHLL